MSNNEEWSVVTKNDKRRVAQSRQRRRQSPHDLLLAQKDEHLQEDSWTEEIKDGVMKMIEECVEQLKKTDFHCHLLKEWRSIFSTDCCTEFIDDIVCYGIGNFAASNSAAMWQLAGAVCLRDFLLGLKDSSSDSDENSVQMSFFDPCTTTMELQILGDLKIKNLASNERGKRSVGLTPTLFYMPHCPKNLYGNVLWANWGCLHLVVVFGNSLRTYHERNIGKDDSGISSLVPFIHEKVVSCSKSDVDIFPESAFNDSYLTWFSSIDLESFPPQPEEYTVSESGNGGEVL